MLLLLLLAAGASGAAFYFWQLAAELQAASCAPMHPLQAIKMHLDERKAGLGAASALGSTMSVY